MPRDQARQSGFTVGSLLGTPLGALPSAAENAAVNPTLPAALSAVSPSLPSPAALVTPVSETSTLLTPPPGIQEAPGWIVVGGHLLEGKGQANFRPDGVETLTFSNPFGQNVERAWFDGKIVFALDVGEVDVDPDQVKVAQEYQIVYSVALDENGKLRGEPAQVDGQYNIYDSTPGMDSYSPIWQFNYVIVPQGYQINSLRSASDCENSGYTIVRSRVFEN